MDLLDAPRPGREDVDEEELKANAELLRQTLAQFDVEVESVSVTPGPVVTLYELVPASGVKISRIVSLENDIALKLAAKGIRIMAPIPGKSAVGVEIPNSHTSLVTIRSIINSNSFRETSAHLPVGMGKTIAGRSFHGRPLEDAPPAHGRIHRFGQECVTQRRPWQARRRAPAPASPTTA